jgi:hypothetical protein
VKTSLSKGTIQGLLLGYKIAYLGSFEGQRDTVYLQNRQVDGQAEIWSIVDNGIGYVLCPVNSTNEMRAIPYKLIDSGTMAYRIGMVLNRRAFYYELRCPDLVGVLSERLDRRTDVVLR